MINRSEPIRHTCPDIDAAIDSLKSIGKEIDKAETIDDCDLKGWSSVIDDIVYGNHCVLEKLRTSNSSLREWGNDLVSDIEGIENENEQLQKEIRRLEDIISNLEDKLSDAEDEIRQSQSVTA